MKNFNPRARGGRDDIDAETAALVKVVSIHAPAGGATGDRVKMAGKYLRFNPRARGGRDRQATSGTLLPAGFNPRAHRGRDSLYHDKRKLANVSIHAPAGGARPQICLTKIQANAFQSTRPRGARHARGAKNHALQHVSIHAPAGGATVKLKTTESPRKFQSTRPRGARL